MTPAELLAMVERATTSLGVCLSDGNEADEWLIDNARALARLCAEQHEALVFAQQHAKESWWANAVSDDGTPLGNYPVDAFNRGQARLTAAVSAFTALGEPSAIGEEGGA